MSKTKHTYRHIGYFNDYQDIQELFLRTADEIVKYMKNGWGAFHFCEGERDSDIDKIEGEPDENLLSMTADKEFIVKYQRGGDEESWFIDIYQYHILEIVEENKAEPIYEYCPFCDEEVVLANEFKVQFCPECGKALVPCNLCPLNLQGKCSKDCPLELLANEYNEDTLKDDGWEKCTIIDICDETQKMTKEAMEKGIKIFVNDTYKLNLFYNKNFDTLILCQEDEKGKAYSWVYTSEVLTEDLENAIECILGVFIEKLRFKVLG